MPALLYFDTMKCFKLDSNNQPVEISFEDWSRNQRGSTQLAITMVDYRVSTIFLGIGMGPHEKTLFETMVFTSSGSDYGKTRRYSSYEEALQGHKETVAEMKYHFMR